MKVNLLISLLLFLKIFPRIPKLQNMNNSVKYLCHLLDNRSTRAIHIKTKWKSLKTSDFTNYDKSSYQKSQLITNY